MTRRGCRSGVVMVGAFTLALVLAACSSDDSARSGSTGASASSGADVYATSCASCHVADGSGGQGPAIGDGKAAAKYSDAEMVRLVTNGRAAMPAFSSKLSTDEIDDVVAFVRTALGTESGPSTTSKETSARGGRGSLAGMPPEVKAAADDGDWAVANGDLLAQRAQPDSPISSETVDELKLAWTYDVPGGGQFGNLTTTPLVSGDNVFVGALTTEVHAVDRTTGEQRFVVGAQAGIFGPTGVGLGYGQLYGTRAEKEGGRGNILVAYDAETGKEQWTTNLGKNGSDINVQPVAYGGLVYASTAGYGGGTTATIYALDAETGAIVWDFEVIESDDLWGNPELNSGGGVWYPPAIDAERGIGYWGTGNPYPFPGAKGFPNGSSRPGPNKWTDSMLALDLETGKLVWGHQAIPHDIFDRDAMISSRVDVEINGKPRSLAISTGKLGVVYGLDADTGKEVWNTEVGTHENDELTEIDGPTLVYPGSLGGVQTPIAVAGDTIYACVMNAPTQYEGPEETSFGFTVKLGTADSDFVAIDAATGKVKWSVKLDGDALGGATVAGDLVFTSTFGGTVLALDRDTGKTVWSYQTEGGINGWPAVAGDELYVPVGMGKTPQLLKFELSDG